MDTPGHDWIRDLLWERYRIRLTTVASVRQGQGRDAR